MKKSIFIAVLGAAFTAACYGQGKIQFNNYASSTQTTGIFFGSGALSGQFAGTEISAILLFGASTDTLITQLAPIGSPVAMATESRSYPTVSGGGALTSGAGWFGNPTFTIDAANPGTTYAFAIEATGIFNSVTYHGFLTHCRWCLLKPVLVFQFLICQTLCGTVASAINPVPEPTTLALAGLGGLASLVMMRRKKA